MREPFEIKTATSTNAIESGQIDKILALEDAFFTPTKYQIEIVDEQDSFEDKTNENTFYVKITSDSLVYISNLTDEKSITHQDLPNPNILLEENKKALLNFILKEENLDEAYEMKQSYLSVNQDARVAYIYRRKDLDVIKNKHTEIIKGLVYGKFAAYYEQCLNSSTRPSGVFNPNDSIHEKLLAAFEQDELARMVLPDSLDKIEKSLQENVDDDSFCCQELIISTLTHGEYLNLRITDENSCYEIGIFLDSGPLYQPPNYNHTWNNNLAWLLAHIHKGHPIKVIPEIKAELFNRKTAAHAGEISGFARELALLKTLGYGMELQGAECYLKPPPDKDFSKLTLQEARLMSNDEATISQTYAEIVEDYRTLRSTVVPDVESDIQSSLLGARSKPDDFETAGNIKRQKTIKQTVEVMKRQEGQSSSSELEEAPTRTPSPGKGR